MKGGNSFANGISHDPEDKDSPDKSGKARD